MAQVKFGSAGVSAKEIDLSGPVAVQPSGVPAGVIGTATKGPAFVPVTVGLDDDFYAKFGKTDGKKFGPLAVIHWLKNAQSVTYVRVLGVGDGTKRSASGNTAGSVTRAGFVVGEQQPNLDTGLLANNSYANAGGPLGRTYFLGAFMSESAGSSVFSAAGLQGAGSVTPGITSSLPIVRGILLAASGVILRLSSSMSGVNAAPPSVMAATSSDGLYGSGLGTVVLSSNNQSLQNFTMLLNGHKGTDPKYPNVYTASFDMTAPNYFPNVLNSDPYKINEAGHLLYAYYDIHPALAVVTGTGLVAPASGAQATFVGSRLAGAEASAFLTSGSLARNVGASNVPNYENFETRFEHAASPWIISQKFGGAPSNLFRFHMLDAGRGTADKVKISIENITPSTDTVDRYGTFDVIIRDFADTDNAPRALEQFRGVSLNPSSDRYIAKLIGDLHIFYDFDRAESAQKIVVDGNYQNMSNYVRVEVDSGVTEGTTPEAALPMGFRGPAHLVTSGTMPLTSFNTGELVVTNALKKAVMPPVPYRLSLAEGTGAKALVNSSLYWGVQFEQVTSPSAPNSTNVKNYSLSSFTKYFPDFMTTTQNVVEKASFGVADSDTLGILDADRFNKNQFTLENIRVTTASNGLADPQKWVEADYVRDGNVGTSDADKTRALAVSDLTTPNRRYAKFTLYLQGGFDGTNMMNEDEAELRNAAVKADMDDSNRGLANGPNVKAYLKALEVMKNKTETDIQLLAIPGIRNSVVTDNAIASVEDRFDALFIMDVDEYDTLNTVVTSSLQKVSVQNTVTAFANRALNSSFAAAYFPDVVIQDPNTKTNVICPPSVAVLGAFSLNDAVAYPWFAPAGFTRGALSTTLETRVKLSKDNMDALYNVNINPLTAFANSTPPGTQAQGGVVVWGQKTLQSFASALDRVNVRRLLIKIRRDVKDVANSILFEPSRDATLQKFASGIEPRLAKVQKQQGLKRYLVKVDASTTTQADIENNTLRGKIYVQPTRTIEFVSLDFVVTNAGQSIQ